MRVEPASAPATTISVHYDPMIAKLVVWGEDRFAAVEAAGGLVGLPDRRPPAQRRLPARDRLPSGLRGGRLDTAFIERHRADLLPADGAQPPIGAWAIAGAELTLYQEEIAREAALKTGDPWSPWSGAKGWRLNGEGHGEIRLRSDGTLHKIAVTYKPDGYLFDLPAGRRFVRARRLANGDVRVDIEGRHAIGTVARLGSQLDGVHRGRHGPVRAGRSAGREREVDAAPGHLAAPMPGKVIQVAVKPGDDVKRGATLMVLEAMKMEHSIAAPMDGKIDRVFFKAGDLVEEGAELLAFVEEG